MRMMSARRTQAKSLKTEPNQQKLNEQRRRRAKKKDAEKLPKTVSVYGHNKFVILSLVAATVGDQRSAGCSIQMRSECVFVCKQR